MEKQIFWFSTNPEPWQKLQADTYSSVKYYNVSVESAAGRASQVINDYHKENPELKNNIVVVTNGPIADKVFSAIKDELVTAGFVVFCGKQSIEYNTAWAESQMKPNQAWFVSATCNDIAKEIQDKVGGYFAYVDRITDAYLFNEPVTHWNSDVPSLGETTLDEAAH
ncbi:MAG: hypothetical protein DMENIID0002_08270 [Rickettsia endosymbiont of Sergentomyia squamirostris]|uniref:Uncharacterized protein n=1 Tax=Candidatus Tisiphia endosymbiont of Sergentomyia squamirostris TaxID=3113639 RepID=A0AAT9G8P0_9RICK